MTRPAMHRLAMAAGALAALLLAGCATKPVQTTDYSAFREAHPATLLVLPPVSESTDIHATPAVLAQATAPLAEAGYYVIPVTLMTETFHENGLSSPEDIQAVDRAKLRQIFGADAAVYIRVKRYGSTYTVVSGDAVVALEADIIDLRTGQKLWHGTASASSAEGGSNQGGLAALLIKAIVSQVLNSATDASFRVAGTAGQRLLGLHPNGVLAGPHRPAPPRQE
jgi:hypothetical protein